MKNTLLSLIIIIFAAAVSLGARFPDKLIVIDPGHGGARDTGIISNNNLMEKELNLVLAKKLADILEKEYRCQTILTRDSDVTVSLMDRSAAANKNGADLLVSIHLNYSKSSLAEGPSVFYMSEEIDLKLTQTEKMKGAPAFIQADKEIITNRWYLNYIPHQNKSFLLASLVATKLSMSLPDIPKREAIQIPNPLLAGCDCPAILVEAGFLSHPVEEQKLAREEYIKDLAIAISKGIESYLASE
jgi:N-acetylmuramoyl-L-alanine amidase